MTTLQELTERYGEERATQIDRLIVYIDKSLNQALQSQADDIRKAFPDLDKTELLLCIYKSLFDAGLSGYCMIEGVNDRFDEVRDAVLATYRREVRKAKRYPRGAIDDAEREIETMFGETC